jgi:hypothetical protein
MTDLEKAKKIYAILYPEQTENGPNIPSFEELAAQVSADNQFSFGFKTGKKKLKIDAQLSFRRQDTNDKENTDMSEKFTIAPFLFILALAAAGIYVFTRMFGNKKHDTDAPKTRIDNLPQARTATSAPVKQAAPSLSYLLLALELDKLDKLFPGCSREASIPIQDGRKLFDSSPLLLVDQKKETVDRVKQDALDEKPKKGYAILSIELSAAAMSTFRKGQGNSAQREAFEKLSGKSLLALGFMEKLPDDMDFYDIG